MKQPSRHTHTLGLVAALLMAVACGDTSGDDQDPPSGFVGNNQGGFTDDPNNDDGEQDAGMEDADPDEAEDTGEDEPAEDDTPHVKIDPVIDFNGDGFSDLVVGAPGATVAGKQSAGIINIYYGGEGGVSAMPGTVLRGATASQWLGTVVEGNMDINDDGFSDLAIVGWGRDGTDHRVQIHLGSRAGLQETPHQVYASTEDQYLGDSAKACNFNNDEFDDLLLPTHQLNAPDGGERNGRLELFMGSRDGFQAQAQWSQLGGVNYDVLGSSGSYLCPGDVNGDGFPDLVIKSQGEGFGRLLIFAGGADGLSEAPIQTIDGTEEAPLGQLNAIPDINNDGLADVLLSYKQGEERYEVYLGGRDGLTGPEPFIDPGIRPDFIGTIGDINNDGLTDLAILNAESDSSGQRPRLVGIIRIYHGTREGLPSQPDAVLEAHRGVKFNATNLRVTSAGDVNGDGFMDLVIGDSRANSSAGQVLLYLGSPNGIVEPAAAVFNGLPQNQFGFSAQ